MKKALVLGAAGFLGQHMEYRLKEEGYYVVSVARKPPLYRKSVADEFNILDLTNAACFQHHFYRHDFDECYQLAGEVGGLGFIGTGDHDADILTNSLKINLHTLEAIRNTQACGKILFASSQCVYPDRFEIDPFAAERFGGLTDAEASERHRETDASFNTFAFGKEKLYAEALYEAYARNHGVQVRIGRLGNIYGPSSEWREPRAKAPAAICRKVATAPYSGGVDLWGDGQQRRSFTWIGDAIEGIRRLMASDFDKPLNIASAEMVSIQQLFEKVLSVSGRRLKWQPSEGPIGVRARGSDNTLARKILGWEPSTPLIQGLDKLYPWVAEQVLTKAET